MLETHKERYRKLMPAVLESLKKRRYEAFFFETVEEARRFIPDQIDPGETVGIGGSVTLRQDLGLTGLLRSRGNTVFDHWDAKDGAERLKIKRLHRGADVFLSSLNAFTCDGIMVNLDGGGNRVGGLCSGPRKVIVVAGTNKLVETLDQAIDRTRRLSAPINAARLKRKTPCAVTGICSDCDSPDRVCAALLVLFKKPGDIEKFTVILINEEMGF